jgi:hypothetical protein
MAINDERDDSRDYDGSRNRPRNARRDRGPRAGYREPPRGQTGSNLGSVVREVDRLAYSLTRAGARAYFGTVGAIGDLVVNIADSVYAAPQSHEGRPRQRDPGRDGRSAPRDRNDRYERYDRDDRDDNRGRSDMGASLTADISGNLRQAIRDTADVWSDSMREFTDVFHDEMDRDDEIDARAAAAEDDLDATRPDRQRPRTRPAAPPESPPSEGKDKP